MRIDRDLDEVTSELAWLLRASVARALFLHVEFAATPGTVVASGKFTPDAVVLEFAAAA